MCICAPPDLSVCQTGVNMVYLRECDLLKLGAGYKLHVATSKHGLQSWTGTESYFWPQAQRESLHFPAEPCHSQTFLTLFFFFFVKSASAASYFQSGCLCMCDGERPTNSELQFCVKYFWVNRFYASACEPVRKKDRKETGCFFHTGYMFKCVLACVYA